MFGKYITNLGSKDNTKGVCNFFEMGSITLGMKNGMRKTVFVLKIKFIMQNGLNNPAANTV